MMPRVLDVYLHDRLAGALTDSGMNVYTFEYHVDATEAERLSVSLPVDRGRRFLASEAKPFFEGLLPEERVRADIARQLGIDPADSIGLFAAIGRECAGAVAVLPSGNNLPGSDKIQWLTHEELIDRVDSLPSFPLGRDESSRSRASLAGAQRKMVAVVDGGRVGIPQVGPSTHLLKPQWLPGPDDPQLHDLVANEAFCMRLAKNAGLEVAEVEVRQIGSRHVLFVRRFDRVRDGGGKLVRLHQEDAAQAGGKLPSSKYEQDGGLSLIEVADALDRAGIGRRDLGSGLLNAITIAAATGNADQHAKNIGILYHPQARISPLYDLTSTMVYGVLSRRAAFVVGGELHIDRIDDEACIRAVTEAARMPKRLARDQVSDLTDAIHGAVELTRQEAVSERWMSPIVDEISELVLTWPARACGE